MDDHGLLNRSLFIPFFDRRDGTDRLRHVDEIETFNSLGRDELESVQWQGMLETLRHAFQNIPCYRKKYLEAGVSLSDIRAPSDLTKLPTVTRKDIREHGHEMLADGVDRKHAAC